MKRRIYGLTLAAIAVGAMGALNAAEPGATATATATATTPAAAAAAEHEMPLAISQADAKLQWGDCPALFPPGCKLSVLHGTPDQPGADVFLRVPAGYTIPPHSHTSAERMVLVSGQLDVRYAGHAKVALQRGDYAYGPAMLPHTAHCNGPEACTLFIAFNTAVDALPFEGTLTHAAP